jgi:glycosyltransferase involved in cell wall biosynthesis
VSVVVPAYSEEEAVETTLASIRDALSEAGADFELIVVDDGSTDRTAELAQKSGARVITLPENRGYGAAVKVGVANACHDRIVISDADGTYPARAIPELLEHTDLYEMVVGARVQPNAAIPLARRPAKWEIGWLANYLAGRRVPDLNSGLRVIDRKLFERFEHLFPSGFSFTMTITLAALCNDRLVYYHPIDYHERIGEPKVRARHALEFLILLLRTIVYFNPLKVFLPLGAIFFVSGLAKFVYDLVIGNLSETTLLGFLGAALICAAGLLSDQITRAGLYGGRR